jgi:3-deoxy-D-manno-octulosonate 8-phosphate phosphatase (KDO 8-P phosphatase)
MDDHDISKLAARTELLLLDVDGVLTDGKLLFVPMPDGSAVEAKAFDAQDGSAIALARRCGMKFGILSGRSSPAIDRRAKELKIDFCYQGLGSRKLEAFKEIATTVGLPPERMCYMGDDVQDIPILRQVGFPVAVANACAEAKAAAVYVTTRTGGNGAVREAVELILKAQGKWDSAIAEFLL